MEFVELFHQSFTFRLSIMPAKVYIEDNYIILPLLKDGVTRLGDLWDCHESKFFGENLFSQALDGIYINASPIESVDYELIHSKSTSDTMKTISVGGEISLEILTGLISLKGTATEFGFEHKSEVSRERLICHYSRETFSIYSQSESRKLLDQYICDSIMKNNVKATHYVKGIILGAILDVEILINTVKKENKMDSKGNLVGKLLYGAVNASVKASLSYLDKDENKEYDMKINLKSVPSLNCEPKTIQEMFSMIEKIDGVVEKQQHFPLSSKNIIGVPIKFILAPIKQIFETNIPSLYLKLDQNILNNFSEMLMKIQDISCSGYVLKKVVEKNQYFSSILFDSKNEIYKQIAEYESFLRELALKYFEESYKTLKAYKNGEVSVENLLNIRERFEKECSSNDIFQSILKFAEKGKG